MTEGLLVLLATAGATFFLIRAAQMHLAYRRMGQLEATRVEIEAARARAERAPLRARLVGAVRSLGYDGDLFPFAAGLAFLYLAVAAALSLLSVPSVVAYVVALPAVGGAVATVVKWAAARRRKRFNTQLVELLELVAGQIEGGTGAQRALALVVPTMGEPLRSEMSAVLDTQMVTRDLIGAMRALQERYPSRAFAMFVSALEIDRADGHAIGPALRQAAKILNDDFQLRAEAVAEVAQQRGEFFIILAVLGAMAAYMLMSGDETQIAAYTSPIGVTALGAASANAVWGVYRMLTMLRKLQGDDQ